MTWLGIDPGASGGIAIIGRPADLPPAAWKMPETEAEIWDLIDSLSIEVTHACIEQVSAMPGQGVSSTFKFGQSYGSLRMALTAARIPWSPVTPAKWKAKVDRYLIAPKATKPVKKQRAREVASRLFPHLKITNAIADALLIAEFTRRREL